MPGVWNIWPLMRWKMPRGDKSKYTEKQKRRANHIKTWDLEQDVPEEEAEARPWATVNKLSGGGEKSGSGRRRRAKTS